MKKKLKTRAVNGDGGHGYWGCWQFSPYPGGLVFSGDRRLALDPSKVGRWNSGHRPPGIPVGYGSWGETYLLSTGDDKRMVCPVLGTKGLPREFLPIVRLLLSSGFKFTLPMWSRKPQDEKGMQSSPWLVLSYVCTTGVHKGSPRSLLPKLGPVFEKGLCLQGLKPTFHWPEPFLRHLPSPSCKETCGLSIFSWAQCWGNILDSAHKKEGGMGTRSEACLSDIRCKDQKDRNWNNVIIWLST